MELLVQITDFFNSKIIAPVWNALDSFFTMVLLPLGESIVEWIEKSVPWCIEFADFCTELFKLRYQGRIYSFVLLVPFGAVFLLFSLLIRRKRRKKHVKIKR